MKNRMPPSNTHCPFCLEELGAELFPLRKDNLIEHAACKRCIKEWLENFTQFSFNQSLSCPICHQNVDEVLSVNVFAMCSVCRSHVPKFFINGEKSMCCDCEDLVEVMSD